MMYYRQLIIDKIKSPSKYLNNLSIHYFKRADAILRRIQQLQQLSRIKFIDKASFCALKKLGYIEKNGTWCNRLTGKTGLSEKQKVFLQDSIDLTQNKKLKINRMIGNLFKVASAIVKPIAMLAGSFFIPIGIICDLSCLCKDKLSLFFRHLANSYNKTSTQETLNPKVNINQNNNIPSNTFFYKPRSKEITPKFKRSCRGIKLSPMIKEHLYENAAKDQKELYEYLFNTDKTIEDLKIKCEDIGISYRSRSKKAY